jgi:hypothetical protein
VSRLARVLVFVAAVAALGAGTASPRTAKLSQKEQAWVAPLLKVFSIQNAGLHLVVGQAAAKNALVAGEKPQNLALTNTLAALISCKVPKDVLKQAGPPPTARLLTFRNALNSACIHDLNGAHDFAKAIGAVTKNNSTLAGTLLKSGVAEFKRGSGQLTKAYKSITALGGSNLFKA